MTTSFKPSKLHELKSPLTAAQLGLQLIEEELRVFDFEKTEILRLIKQVGEKLTEISVKLEDAKDLLSNSSIKNSIEGNTNESN
jgi:signal transduction histidine kinase